MTWFRSSMASFALVIPFCSGCAPEASHANTIHADASDITVSAPTACLGKLLARGVLVHGADEHGQPLLASAVSLSAIAVESSVNSARRETAELPLHVTLLAHHDESDLELANGLPRVMGVTFRETSISGKSLGTYLAKRGRLVIIGTIAEPHKQHESPSGELPDPTECLAKLLTRGVRANHTDERGEPRYGCAVSSSFRIDWFVREATPETVNWPLRLYFECRHRESDLDLATGLPRVMGIMFPGNSMTGKSLAAHLAQRGRLVITGTITEPQLASQLQDEIVEF